MKINFETINIWFFIWNVTNISNKMMFCNQINIHGIPFKLSLHRTSATIFSVNNYYVSRSTRHHHRKFPLYIHTRGIYTARFVYLYCTYTFIPGSSTFPERFPVCQNIMQDVAHTIKTSSPRWKLIRVRLADWLQAGRVQQCMS